MRVAEPQKSGARDVVNVHMLREEVAGLRDQLAVPQRRLAAKELASEVDSLLADFYGLQ